MKRKNKGFTLIELLAVIVILGLLMAIAIPSVTKYITESRKKTLTTTVGNYIGALVNEVNDLSYTFTGQNTIYAVPIECISLERGGTSPFGEWYQANDAYFAYVLIQYDDENSKYVYGFTFKDSAGYGLYPIIESKIKEKGSQIKTGLDLNKPTTGDLTSLTTLAKWQESGFDVDSTTSFQVLEAESEGAIGNGTTTCTLCQKGKNYAQIEEEKAEKNNTLVNLVKRHSTLITSAPTLTTSINNTSDVSGLYSSTDTNSGNPTYYFRGNVTNNYVSFAGLTWRIIRINEDGTIRLTLNSSIDNKRFVFVSNNYGVDALYYSNSDVAKSTVDKWYEENIQDTGYDSYVASETFCEQLKVVYNISESYGGNATVSDASKYIPNFKCSTDGNGKGVLKSKVGLISYDEVIFAGGHRGSTNKSYYLSGIAKSFWILNTAGLFISSNSVDGWYVYDGYLTIDSACYEDRLVPVINLNADVLATGTGTSTDPYVIQTN